MQLISFGRHPIWKMRNKTMFEFENHKDEWLGFLDCDKLIYDAIKENRKLKAKIKELEAELSKKD